MQKGVALLKIHFPSEPLKPAQCSDECGLCFWSPPKSLLSLPSGMVQPPILIKVLFKPTCLTGAYSRQEAMRHQRSKMKALS